jgi:hypothetical protein
MKSNANLGMKSWKSQDIKVLSDKYDARGGFKPISLLLFRSVR